MRDQPVTDQLVAPGLLGVVADHEPFRPRPGVPGRHPDFLDPQVPGEGAVAARAGQADPSYETGAAALRPAFASLDLLVITLITPEMEAGSAGCGDAWASRGADRSAAD